MSGSTTSEEFGSTGRSSTVDMHSEWRSIEQVDNDTPSTSPPYYDSDDSDDGPKPSELYGRHTWKIEKFLTIKKKEQLRGEVFDIGGYKWYILIYPQGCDVDNYLSLFLCVANHEKLLPGWSHLAQFSISVVNKDPKKTKYSDTLHRFWKKEHDWGWKKFMELSKIKDGFIDDEDNLVIKAQVQVIRERTNEPFRCLDYHYRRELVRVYLSNVEQQVCRHFFEEKRSKIFKLIDDKPKWSSFRAFWVGIDRVSKRRISKERTDSILKLMVKQFFVEKEVTSTLVMDSLNTGLKALKDVQHTKGKTLMGLGSNDSMPDPLVYIDGEDYFVLSDDVINLLDRVKSEPFLYKDDKVYQNGKKDGISSDEYTKDSIESEEWRLTKIGRRTIEIFVLSHIFNRIEVLYQEAIALRRQEELIREEEELILNSDLRAKNNKDKRNSSKKKTAKQKRNGKKENKGNKGKEDFTLAGKPISGSTESGKPIPTKPEISETELSDDNIPNSIEIAEIVEITPPKDNVSTEIKLQDFAINNNNSNSKGKNSRKVNNRSVININNNNNNNNGEINEKEMVVNQYGETPSHSGRYYSKSSNRGPRSESENLVASLKDRIKLIQQRLVEVEDSLLKDFNAKELSEVFAQTETTGTDSSSSSSPMKNPSRQTLEAKMQKLEKDQQTLDNKKQILEKNKQTLVASEETLRRTKELLLRRRNKETTKQAKKDTVPVPTNTIHTNVPVSKTENQKPKQKQIAKEKSTIKSTNTSTGTSNGTTAKVLPQIKTTPSLEISNPPVSTSTITAKPPVILSQSSPLTIPSDHGLRFGTFNIETLNKSNPTSSGTTSSDKLLLEDSPRETLITNTQVGDELEIASSKAVQEEFPHLDIINDLLDEDQQGSGYNQSFFTRQYSVPASHADISPRWAYPVENYYEGFPRVYGSSYDMNMNVPPPYSERQLEILRNQNAYISMVRNSNGFSSSPYRLEDYEYSNTTNLGNGGIHNNGYNLYYRTNGTNGNLGPLQS